MPVFKIQKTALRMAAIAALAGSVAGCTSLDSLNPFAGEKYETRMLADVPADTMYNQGLTRLRSGDAEGAAKRFSAMERRYSGTNDSRRALLMETYASYEARKYDDALNGANRYVGLYPKDKDVPYALYLGAMSYYNQIPDVTRDQESSEKALNLFQRIIRDYPQSEYAADAKFKAQVVADQLAGKEMTVGRFYLERRNYSAAINRFQTVLGRYQTTRHTEEALARLAEAYLAMGIQNEAQTAGAILGHNFPASQWYKDTYALLQSGGLEPREDQGSLISRTFRRIGLT